MDAGEIGGIIICIDVITDQIEAKIHLFSPKRRQNKRQLPKHSFCQR
jgi:hypothetical protein